MSRCTSLLPLSFFTTRDLNIGLLNRCTWYCLDRFLKWMMVSYKLKPEINFAVAAVVVAGNVDDEEVVVG